MKIQAPTVGPIVGYTTTDQVRLWLRGKFQKTPDGYCRCFGVARLRESGVADFAPPKYVKLPPHFDMTGVCVFTGLQPETAYEYQAGWFFAETDLDNLNKSKCLDWSNAFSGMFCTGTVNPIKPRSYIVGSCRYLLKLFGGDIFDDRGDKTFYSVLEQICKGKQVDALVMVGDQIYADDLNFLAPDTALDQFLDRYRTVFAQPYLLKLMSQVPTYMVLDDHEIEDNWPSKACNKDWLKLYPMAIHAYQIYQCSHSPLFDLDAGRITGTLDHFWYSFQDGCCDWFVMDSRTERTWDKDPKRRRMLKRTQMDAFLKWLKCGSGRVKLIVTSVPFFPDIKSESDDKWSGFLAERTEILDTIFKEEIRKVVFLSGDVHCSLTAELTSPKDKDFKVISVVSSPFFWPYPHMDDRDFVLEGKLKSNSKSVYQVGGASDVFSTDNFARVDVDTQGIKISFYKRKGGQLGQTIWKTF